MMQLDSQNWSCRLPRSRTCQLVDDASNPLCQAGFESVCATRRYCDAHVSQPAREKAKNAARKAQPSYAQGREARTA
jgi:hypothetical protein